MGGKYYIRNFTPCESSDFKIFDSDTLTDIYLHFDGFTNIGIKFRNPIPKKYGWKVKSFYCKIMEQYNYYGQYFLEKWKKYIFDFDHPLKIKIRKVNKKSYYSDSEYSDNYISYEKLKKYCLKIYDAVCKVLKHSYIKKDPVILDWCFPEQKHKKITNNLYLFVIYKNKTKYLGKYIGNIKIENIIHEPFLVFYFQTYCFYSSKSYSIVNKIQYVKGTNMSYPSLLESLRKMSFSKSKL